MHRYGNCGLSWWMTEAGGVQRANQVDKSSAGKGFEVGLRHLPPTSS
jgi:hypothetical protein